MTQWTDLLATLDQAQAGLLMDLGQEERAAPQQVLLAEGAPVRAMVFVLEGLLHVRTAALGSEPLAVLGAGGIFGEQSFLDPSVASATVVAVEAARVLVIDHEALRQALEADPGAAAAIYRSLARVGARRLRRTTAALDARQRALLEHTDPLALRARLALVGFQELMLSYDKALIAGDEEAAATIEGRISTEFGTLTRGMNDLIGRETDATVLQRQTVGGMVQRTMMPYLQQTEIARRMYTKPRGYAGDFYTIELMYRDQPGGLGRLGRTMDRCFLDEPAAAAVRNRRGLLAEEIEAELQAKPEGPVRITSLACGPAREIFDVYQRSADAGRLQPTLVDMDGEALAFVKERLAEQQPSAPVELVRDNLIYLALGRSSIELPPQDLVYSIGLIDYFEDGLVIKLLDWVHGLLRPGGRAIFGNFHPANTSRAMMDHMLEWRLIHRSEADMNRLFEASRFGKPCSRILWEEQRVNLFAECVR